MRRTRYLAVLIAAACQIGWSSNAEAQATPSRQGPVYGLGQGDADQPNFINTDTKFGSKDDSRIFPFSADRDSEQQFTAYRSGLHEAACVVGKNSDESLEALTTNPSTAMEKRQLKRLLESSSGCEFVITNLPSIQRGMIAEAKYLADFAEPPRLPENINFDLVDRFTKSELPRNKHRPQAEATLIDATNCLVMSDLRRADQLARATPGSDQEAVLMDELFARAPYCAGETRPEFISRTFLRAFLMDSLYQASQNLGTSPLFKSRLKSDGI